MVFTSGATEANNLAILGLAEHGEKRQRKHIISTLIEHKAVLEPLEELERRGFDSAASIRAFDQAVFGNWLAWTEGVKLVKPGK